MDLLIVKLATCIINVLLIVGKPISSVSLKYLVIEINVYNIALILSIMTLMIKKPPFFGQLCIGVNIQYVVRMIMHLFLTGC